MFDFTPDPAMPKAQLYRQLVQSADSLTAGESDGVANMANVAALLAQFLPGCNWTGFYRLIGGELVLGPFAGRPACLRIALGQGVCGAAAASGRAQLVADVHAFPGHIACDPRSRTELVVPVMRDGAVVAVIDLDSPAIGAFDEADQQGIEALAQLLANRI